MRFVKLGNSNIDVSIIGLGTWAIGGRWWGGTDEKDSIEAIIASIDSGINFIDTAPAYGQGLAEEFVAKAINGRRDKIILATKCGLRWDLKKGFYFFDYSPGVPVYRYLGKDSIEHELDLSLKRLKTDYIDLYQSHWQDPTTPISETMETFLNMKQKGKIRVVGVSNASIDQVKEYTKYGVLNTDQEKYNLLDRNVETELLPWCRQNNTSMLAYSPMAKGLLTGKIPADRKFGKDDSRFGDARYSPENILRMNNLLEKHLKKVCESRNATFGQISTAWLTKDPNVIPLCGARNKKQALENVFAAELILSSEDLASFQNFLDEYNQNPV